MFRNSFVSVHTSHLLASLHQTVDNHLDCFWLLVIWGRYLEVWTQRAIYIVGTDTSVQKMKQGLLMASPRTTVGLQTHLETCAAASSSELRSISKISSFCPLPIKDVLAAAALTEGTEMGGVSSSLRGSPLCFFLRLFFFFVASVLRGSGGSSGSATSSSMFAALCSTSEIQNRWLSVGIGEVAKWAGTSCYRVKQEHTGRTLHIHE